VIGLERLRVLLHKDGRSPLVKEGVVVSAVFEESGLREMYSVIAWTVLIVFVVTLNLSGKIYEVAYSV
jgi:hypothetical protein